MNTANHGQRRQASAHTVTIATTTISEQAVRGRSRGIASRKVVALMPSSVLVGNCKFTR